MKKRTAVEIALIVVVIVVTSVFIGFLIGSNNVQQTTTVNISAATKEKIDINKAGYEELKLIPGVGDKLAEKIIEKRNIKKFDSIYELVEIEGIGEEKIKLLEGSVKVE